MKLATERLLLRPLAEGDLDALTELNSDPEVMRFIMDGRVLDRTGSGIALKRMLGHWETHGFGLFAVESRATGAFLGWAGLSTPWFLPEVLPAVEIGWRLNRDAWGHGYATEAARAVVRLAFDDLGLDELLSIRQIGNARSARVMEKLGIAYAFDATVPSTGQQVAVHSLRRPG